MTLLVGLVLTRLIGDAEIKVRLDGDWLVLRTSARFAGAVSSLKWRGFEFVNTADHGREIQSASNLDLGTPIRDETYNPTEAGSRDDGAGEKSSSKLAEIRVKNRELWTKTQMAFWLAPGETSEGPAKNQTVLSNHFLEKHIALGISRLPQAIRYDVRFLVPRDEHHNLAVFETLTGYMNPALSEFLRFDSRSGELVPIDDGPGEQADPIAFSTPDGKFAVGIFNLDQPLPGDPPRGYGRWKFKVEQVVKWNCVFRVNHPVAGKAYAYHHYVLVGTRDMVSGAFRTLAKVPKHNL